MANNDKVIKICMGSSCFSRGNKENLEIIRDFIKTNSIEAEIHLTGNLCEGNCNIGPNVSIDGNDYSNVDENKIISILNKLVSETSNV